MLILFLFIRNSREDSIVEGVTEDFDHKSNAKSQIVMENNTQERSNKIEGYTVRDIEIAEGDSFQEAKADDSENPTALSTEENDHSFPDDLDIQTWEPPKPYSADNVENSVICDDDDEEQGIGIADFGEQTSMSSAKDELGVGNRLREERQRELEKVMNGKFKDLVGQLLKSVGVSSSTEDDKSWVDIITYLSWEAAAFLKPDAIEGNAMNPDGFVKVKCIAVGSPSQR
jgi:1-phosphatidylinositol-3-phosphate 5-kinase